MNHHQPHRESHQWIYLVHASSAQLCGWQLVSLAKHHYLDVCPGLVPLDITMVIKQVILLYSVGAHIYAELVGTPHELEIIREVPSFVAVSHNPVGSTVN